MKIKKTELMFILTVIITCHFCASAQNVQTSCSMVGSIMGNYHFMFSIMGINHSEITMPDSLKGKGIKKITTKNCDDDGEDCETVVSTYNKGEFLTGREDYDDNGKLKEKKIYTYNNNDQLVSYKDYDEKGLLEDSEEYRYDSVSHLVEFTDYDKMSEIERRLSCVYDSNTGRVVKQVQTDDDGDTVQIMTFSDFDDIKHSYKITTKNRRGKLISTRIKEYQLFE